MTCLTSATKYGNVIGKLWLFRVHSLQSIFDVFDRCIFRVERFLKDEHMSCNSTRFVFHNFTLSYMLLLLSTSNILSCNSHTKRMLNKKVCCSKTYFGVWNKYIVKHCGARKKAVIYCHRVKLNGPMPAYCRHWADIGFLKPSKAKMEIWLIWYPIEVLSQQPLSFQFSNIGVKILLTQRQVAWASWPMVSKLKNSRQLWFSCGFCVYF